MVFAYLTPSTRQFCLFVAAAALVPAPTASFGAESRPAQDPLKFFEGRTESVSTIKLVTKKPYRSRTVGTGQIASDGSLHLVQRVMDDGKGPFTRIWHMRSVGPRRFAGTMSEARGPVTVDEVGGRFRFRFKMKGNVSVEQWLTPMPDGRSARSTLTIRKLGMNVGSSAGTIRKL